MDIHHPLIRSVPLPLLLALPLGAQAGALALRGPDEPSTGAAEDSPCHTPRW